MTRIQLIELKLSRLQSVPDAFIDGLNGVASSFERKVLKLISQFEQKDGTILRNKKNLNLLAEIESQLKNNFLETNYPQLVSNYIGEFNEQAVLSDDYFKKVFEGITIPSIAKDILELKKETTLNLLFSDKSIDVEFINPLKATIDDAVTAQATFSETLDAIQNIVTGNADVDGKIMQYSKQVAYDSFAVSDRAYMQSVSESIKAEWYQYAGGIIADSREFCIQRHNKYFHKIEIEEWASLDWAGKMEGTNSKTIFQAAGGHRCGHDILPVSIFIVPKEVIQRNISSGNYQPSKFEVEELGLSV